MATASPMVTKFQLATKSLNSTKCNMGLFFIFLKTEKTGQKTFNYVEKLKKIK